MEAMLWQGLPHGGVQVVYDIRYGLRARNTYMTGEGMTWDFGAVVVTIQYTLYPEALAIDQVHETSAALSWAMDHIHEYGGDPSRIFLTGHSSGAHVCSMVVWRRFSGGGVFALSAMSPAIGGPARFVSSSPAPLFDTLMSAAADAAAAAAGAVAAGVVAGRDGDAVVGGASAAASFGASFDCPKSPLLVATAIPTTATTSAPSAPSPPSTSAIARSRALGQVAAVSADAAASLRPILPPSNLRAAATRAAAVTSIRDEPVDKQSVGSAFVVARSTVSNRKSEASYAAGVLTGSSDSRSATSGGGSATSGGGSATSGGGSATSGGGSATSGGGSATSGGGSATSGGGSATSGGGSATAGGGSATSGGGSATSVADAVNRATSKQAVKQALRSHLLNSSPFKQQEAAAAAVTEAPTGALFPPAGNALSPPSDQEASSSEEADPLSSDCFSSRFLAPSSPSPLDILRQELGGSVAEAVVAALSGGRGGQIGG
ncbi:unnamed protein product [Closterium sp. NIES-64]|nr:unnamed protein product [Closterium sp. NIES-64]